jgi:hypothetical protein
VGSNALNILMTAGPKIVTKRAGKIKRIKGNTNLTGSLAAISSAL